ncbi:hypothetical protein MYU51_017947 [Penicillium brevicompactum]
MARGHVRLVSNLTRHANPPHPTSSSKTLAASAKASTSPQFRSGLILLELVGVVSRPHDSIEQTSEQQEQGQRESFDSDSVHQTSTDVTHPDSNDTIFKPTPSPVVSSSGDALGKPHKSHTDDASELGDLVTSPGHPLSNTKSSPRPGITSSIHSLSPYASSSKESHYLTPRPHASFPPERSQYPLGPLKGLPEYNTEDAYTNLEEACLMRHFTENLSYWFDTCDRDRHFQLNVPERALFCPVLRFAVYTASAGHLTRLAAYRDDSDCVVFGGIRLHGLTSDSAVRYHDTCISYLIELSNNPNEQYNEDVLTAATILRFYEQIDAPSLGIDSEAYLNTVQFIVHTQHDDSFYAYNTIHGPPRDQDLQPLYFKDADPANGDFFPVIWHNNACQAVGAQHIELSRILLAVSNPRLSRLGLAARAAALLLEEELRGIIRRLCGIALSNSNPVLMVDAAVGISVCGEYFTDVAEQNALLEFLADLEYRHAWPTAATSATLKEAWRDKSTP